MSAQPDVSRLGTHQHNLRTLLENTEKMAAALPRDSGGAVVEVCALIHRLLDDTAAESLRGLNGAVAQGTPYTRQYVEATARVDEALDRLCAAVAVVSDEQGPEQAVFPREAALHLLTELDHLLDALQRLAAERHHGEGWTVDVQRIVRKFRTEVSTLRGVAERAVRGRAEDRSTPTAAETDSAQRLGTTLGKLAFQERCLGEALRVGAVLLLLLIAGLAYTVLWRPPTDTAALTLDLARLTTAVPLALLALYLKHESAVHRTGAARLRELEIQLTHVGAFFPPEEQGVHRAAIWSRLTPVLPTPDATPDPGEDLPTILERLTELLKSLGLPLR